MLVRRFVMKLVDFFTSTRRPEAGTPVRSREEVLDALMGLNRPTAPYQLVDGQAEGVDTIAEWKIVDAQWYELDPTRHEVRAMDREYTVEWRVGVPTLSLSVQAFKGQKQEISFGTAYAFTETLAPGQVYKYRFNTNEIKKPIQGAVTGCGWTYKGVAFGKL
jgi:hypothetical protein